jgi:hypothetical protein
LLQLRKCDGWLETTSGHRCSKDVPKEIAMQTRPSFAYSLSQVEEGWRWSVYDEDGVTVARGADASRDRAQAAVDRTLRRPPPSDAARQTFG